MFGQQIYNYDANCLNGPTLNFTAYKQVPSPLKEMNDLKNNNLDKLDNKSNTVFNSINNHINSTNSINTHESNQKINILNKVGCNFDFGFHFDNSKSSNGTAVTNCYFNAAAVVALTAKNSENLAFNNSIKQNYTNSEDFNYNESSLVSNKPLNTDKNETYKSIANDDMISFPSTHSQSYSSLSVSNSSPMFDEGSSLNIKPIQKSNESIWSNFNKNRSKNEKKGRLNKNIKLR